MADPVQATAQRWALTCEACRFGDHASCPRHIIVQGGRMHGVHYCACPAPHPRGPDRAA